MKKFVSLCTTLSMMLSMLATLPVFADDMAADVEISTLAELEVFRDDVNSGNTYEGKTVKLTVDIDMSKKYGEDKESWEPIGRSSVVNLIEHKPFMGTFNGKSHTISNLYIYFDNDGSYEDENSIAAGLFGGNDGVIKNLNVSGIIISNYYDSAGGISGCNSGIIEQCSYSGYIESRAHMGGIVGANYGTITDCCNTVDVVTAEHCGGGIVGTNLGGTISRCYNTGNLTRGDEAWSDYFGSIAGGGGTATDCYYLENTYDKGIYFDEYEVGEDTTTALTAEQFADKSNFANWDFETVWEMNDTLKRPVLRSNKENPPIETNMYEIKYENEKAVVTVSQSGTYAIIFAAYDSDGRLLSVSAQNVRLIQGKNEPIEPKPDFNKNSTVKVMLWGGLNGMKPLCSLDEK